MDRHSGRQRRFPAVVIAAIVFVLCIVQGQFWIAKWFPAMAGLVRITPALVLFEIPVRLPVPIDMLLVPGLFFLIYPLMVLLYPSRPGMPSGRQALQRAQAAFSGFFVLLVCMALAGLIYYLAQDYLPANIRNGINSFGMNVDINLPYPAYENIHLRGSTILFVGFITGMWFCIRKIRKEPGMPKPVPLTREQRMTPYQRMMDEKRLKEKQTRIAETPNVAKPAISRMPAGTEQAIARPGRNSFPRLCHSQPVVTLRPEAARYMPMV